MLGDICILSLLFQCLETLFREHIHPVFAFLNIRIIIFSRTHPCRQNPLGRDASPQDFSSLQTESPRQGCIAPGFFIPADRISSAGIHCPGIFHPYRQNLLGMDASPPQLWPKLAGRPRSPPSSPQFTSTLAGRTLIKPAVPIFKLPAFIPDDLFPVSRGTFRIQFPHDEFSLRMRPGNFSRPPVFIL